MTNKPDEFKLELLKHIYKQQEFLNEHSHKYLTVFQTMATAIVVAGVAVFVSWKSLSVSADVAKASIRALEWLLGLTGAFFVVVVLTNIASWWDYRIAEAELLDEAVGVNFRSKPSLKSSWRWFEAWLVVLVMCVVVGGFVFSESVIVPLIR